MRYLAIALLFVATLSGCDVVDAEETLNRELEFSKTISRIHNGTAMEAFETGLLCGKAGTEEYCREQMKRILEI